MLTPEQLIALRAAVLADATAAAFFVAPGNADGLQDHLNGNSTFIARRKVVESSAIGPVLNYVAVSSLTVANRDRATTFLTLNPVEFNPTADVEAYWDTTFGGTLGGEGLNTRNALKALWRRIATRAERFLATGVGTDALPGTLSFEGDISSLEARKLIYRDDGTIWS